MKKRLILVGPLPRNRIEGVSTSFRTLVTGLPQDDIAVINSNWMRDVKTPGRFNFLRAVESLGVILRVAIFMPRARSVYLIVASSRWGFLRDAVIVCISSLFRRPVVGHLHGGGMRAFYVNSNKPLRWLIRQVYARISTIIVLGEELRSQFRFVSKTTEIAVVPNGLPSDMEPDAFQNRRLHSPVRLLYLSNITPSKGLGDLIEALAILRRTIEVELHVCGAFLSDVDGGSNKSGEQFADRLRERINALQLNDSVIFYGTVLGAEKKEVFKNSDLLILPTYYKWEGQPICIIEAQAWSLPVVATDHRAIGDSVIFGKSAERCQPHQPYSIVEAVNKVVASPESYAEYTAAAFQNYSEFFRMDTHIQNMRNVIEEGS